MRPALYRHHHLIRLAGALLIFLLAVGGWWVQSHYQRNITPLGPQRRVETTNPKAGVHTRLDNEVEAWKIKKTLEMVRELGTPWIVEYFPWAYSEPRKGHYNFTHADMVVEHANRQGLTIIARLGMAPDWAHPQGTIANYLPAENYQDFADYAAEFVRHFEGRVHYVVIWDEHNLALEWGYRTPDPAAYTALLKTVTPAIRNANPNVQILAGALAPTLGDPAGELGMNDLKYLQAMYDAGAAPYFDALAVHSYGLTYTPDDPPHPEIINFRRVELLRQIMIDNGDRDKPIHITEAGWNDHPRWTRAVRPAQRIRYTIRAYQMALDWPWLDSLSMWVFRYPVSEKSFRQYFSFVTTDFRPKPIYYEVQKSLRGWE